MRESSDAFPPRRRRAEVGNASRTDPNLDHHCGTAPARRGRIREDFMQGKTLLARSGRGSRARADWRLAARLLMACTALGASTIIAAANELPLQRVVVSTSGLAQFTHAGTATAGDKLELSVRLDQVDDILKSLTVFDREGALGAVTLAGKAPLQELFRDLPFGPDAINSPASLVNALVGSEIEIDGQVKARGRVFRVEDEKTRLPNNGGEITRHRLALLTDNGLVQAVLEEVSALRFVDPQTNAQVARALAGLSQNRAKDRRAITIDLLGQGSRPVGFSYVVAAPVWKAAYRLVLPKDGSTARLQGWAVVENLTGSDWHDVDFSLVSGNPVALKQPLYTAFYVDRPEIPVAASTRLVPKTDDADAAPPTRAAAREAMPKQAVAMRAVPLPAPAPVAAAAMPAEAIGYAANAAESEEASTQVLFRFPAKLSLASGSTMMVPFVDRDVPAARAWLYQPQTNMHHPLAAVRMRNDGDSALPPGLITAFDTGADGTANFAGDAQLPLTPRGDAKFITFALDSKTDIRREDRGIRETQIGKVVNGVLTLTVRSLQTMDYEITPPADEDRAVVIEEARGDGWKPLADAKDVEETATRIRYKMTAPRGRTTKATLALERVEYQSIALSTLAPERVLATIMGIDNASPALKDATVKLGGLVIDLNSATARRAELVAEAKRIADDQARIRQNLAAVGQSSDLGRRYVDALRKGEDRLTEIAAADKALQTEIADKRKAAEDLAKNLSS
jgi:hypothetical protein